MYPYVPPSPHTYPYVRHALLSTTAVYVATTDVRKRDALALFG
jgi:hypothetical protein